MKLKSYLNFLLIIMRLFEYKVKRVFESFSIKKSFIFSIEKLTKIILAWYKKLLLQFKITINMNNKKSTWTKLMSYQSIEVPEVITTDIYPWLVDNL